ncbi:PadR family transcriptional regulator [Cryptosporangium sp. NPDC048952]|uniref:PadR family transcriptional regulator n=1 Tax=Cryptosporangium sp. NPDC048952 TaxID=3363961 RepID=UPI00370FB99B
MPDLNPTAASLLGFLHEGDFSGYDLVRVAEQLIGDFWSLSQSQVYRELAALTERGYVEGGEVGARSKRRYRITDAGRDAFAQWLSVPPSPEQIRFPLLLTIAFGAHVDRDRLSRFIDDHRREHEKRLREYRETVTVTPQQRATLAFGLRYEQAVLDWMDDLPALLTDD